MAGAAFGSCLRTGCCRARGSGAKFARQAQHFGDGAQISWQAQYFLHLGVCLRGRGNMWQLSRGAGCCRARGSGAQSA